MATEWRIKGTELANCNCAYGCPCQFNSLPTHGNCRAAVGFEIEEGNFADVRLDGLRSVLLISFPGPVCGMSWTTDVTSTTVLSPFSTPSL